MITYCVGIDTGGTFTDAVLMDNASGRIVAWSKERTTPHDLSLGVGRALAALFQQGFSPAEVGRLAVSTTLATNAVVEGRGARVGLFVLGYVRHFKLPVTATIFFKGGHSITGEEEVADAASSALADIRRKMRAASARVRDGLREPTGARGRSVG